jgi:hypothetical protein
MISTIQTVKSDFDKVIAHSQGIANPQTQELLEQWYEAKKDIIEAWGGLIVESSQPVTLHLSEATRRERLNEFIDTVEYNYDNCALAGFLEFMRKDFFENRTSEPFPLGEGAFIPKGMKIIKAFKFFESQPAVLEDLQTRASMIIQENSVSGTLCLSVHPLDFLSASENTHKWRSCHALDGEYRAGNLSYMLDRSTIISYLKTDNGLHKLPSFPEDVLWNSKKWRMWLFLEDQREALFAGRQYPFFSATALDLVQVLYTEYTAKDKLSHWSTWYNDYIVSFPRKSNAPDRDCDLDGGRHVALGGRIYLMSDLVKEPLEPLHYNDLLYSSCYIPYYSWNRRPQDWERKLQFNIGSMPKCLECGKELIGEIDGGSMRCYDCESKRSDGNDANFVHCVCCDRRVPRRLAHWGENVNGWHCRDCWESETAECGSCGDRWYKVDLVFNREKQAHLCPCCRGERKPTTPPGWEIWDALPF